MTGTSVCSVISHEGISQPHFSRETVEKLLASGKFFWLDLDKPGEGDFELHPGIAGEFGYDSNFLHRDDGANLKRAVVDPP